MRKDLLILILTIFILTSTPAMAGNKGTDVTPIANLDFTDKVVYFLDHTSDPENGNWITLENSYSDRSIQLPQPIKITYNGPKYKEYGGASGSLNKDEEESYTITYPSSSSYTNHPVYLSNENVTMTFHGESGLEEGTAVDIYLLKATSDCIYGLLDSFQAGDIENLNILFQENVEEYETYDANIGAAGDLSYDLGCLDAGQYFIVMVQKNDAESLTVLSSTAFVVAEYELDVSCPPSIKKGDNLDISIQLKDGDSEEGECTYGAVLIKEQRYKANIEIDSDGTKNGTSVIVNDMDIIEEFEINSSNYRSKLTKNELQTEIQTLIGEGNGAIAIGETGQNELSITTFDLPVGCYYLFVGAYSPEKGLVGLSQQTVPIKSKGSSNGGGNSGHGSSGGSGGGAGGSPEPAKNVKIKELCQQFVSNNNRIKYEFTKKATCVGYIEFDARKNAGKITTIVEELNGKSSLTPTEPEGEIYKHLNIWVGNGGFATPENIENAIVGFKVSKDWIDEKDVIADSLTLQHFSDNRWYSLPTRKVDEDDDYIYFEAETPGFSPFAITASKTILQIEEPEVNENQPASEVEQQDNSGSGIESDSPSEEKGSLGSKIAFFLVGFLAVILIGTVVLKKVDQNNEDEN